MLHFHVSRFAPEIKYQPQIDFSVQKWPYRVRLESEGDFIKKTCRIAHSGESARGNGSKLFHMVLSNRHSKLLLGSVYRSDSVMVYSDWLESFKSLLSDVSATWDGMLMITGDMNVDLLRPDKSSTQNYVNILQTLSLTQLVTKPTRATVNSRTLIDHIVTNMPRQVNHCDVLPCPLISDHDAPYVCVDVRVTRFVPRHNYIRNERNLDEKAFVSVFEELPLSLIYSTDDPELQLHILNTLLRECIDRHAPLRRNKITRPPAPWMKEIDIWVSLITHSS